VPKSGRDTLTESEEVYFQVQTVNRLSSRFGLNRHPKRRFSRDHIPVITVQPAAVNHPLHGPILSFDLGYLRKSAIQTHFRFDQPYDFEFLSS